jgi:hypothetical protein
MIAGASMPSPQSIQRRRDLPTPLLAPPTSEIDLPGQRLTYVSHETYLCLLPPPLDPEEGSEADGILS